MSSSSPFSLARNVPRRAYYCRAKYADINGAKVLLSVEHCTQPIFSPERIERGEARGEAEERFDAMLDEMAAPAATDPAENRRRAMNRAKIRAFDLLMCNPCLDTFATLTFSPEAIDRTKYADAYSVLRPWLSNRVSRRGLCYICCPEYHKDGESIHFHLLANANALEMEVACSPEGRALRRAGKPLYNITDWKAGFSSAQIIGRSDPREAVAKYVFKYMGKQSGALIGGRYFLAGGGLTRPIYEYGDEIAQFLPDDAPKWTTEMQLPGGASYCKHYTV